MAGKDKQGFGMNYDEVVGRKIAGAMNELDRRKELWGEIVTAYEQGGEDTVKSLLTTRGDETAQKFEALVDQLRKKL